MGFNITKQLLLYYVCVDKGWLRVHNTANCTSFFSDHAYSLKMVIFL
jgi:hypothetical protein